MTEYKKRVQKVQSQDRDQFQVTAQQRETEETLFKSFSLQ
jgi:hypothetical protein